MNKRGRPRNFDREDALQRAMVAFWSKGYEGTSMSDLVVAMGINSPSIYAAFGSKEALFRDAVALYCATEGGRIWNATMAAPTAREAIETLLSVSAEEFTRPDKPRGCLVVLGALHVDEGNEAAQKNLQAHRAHTIATLEQRLKQGVAEGDLPEGPEWRAIATYCITVQQGMAIQARDGASRDTLLVVADCAMAAWDRLVAPVL